MDYYLNKSECNQRHLRYLLEEDLESLCKCVHCAIKTRAQIKCKTSETIKFSVFLGFQLNYAETYMLVNQCKE